MRQEDYKQTVIDPKVRSNANMPLSSMKLPDAKRALADDFPSEHSKRSQIKLEPLEQRRFKVSFGWNIAVDFQCRLKVGLR